MKYIFVSIIAIFILGCNLYGQKKIYEGIMLTGTVKDSVTQMPLKNAEISISSSGKKCITDKNGCYKMIVMSKPDSIFVFQKKYQAKRIRLIKLDNDFLLIKK